ncbi:MAG: M3 family oligoendopeptidase [Planctomycetota bacterium]
MTTMTSDFVPADLDATTWAALEPLYTALRDRTVENSEDLERWLHDRSELDAAASEGRANLYIRMTCRTDDEAITSAWQAYLDEVPPKLKPISFELDKRQVELGERLDLPRERYEVIERDTRVEVELFRDENVSIETELAKLDLEYDKICGDMTVEFKGETKTLAQMGRELEHNDRAHREEAWRLVSERRLRDRERVDDIFDQMIAKRVSLAKNAGFDNYRDYEFRAKHRFDYGPAECERFHEAIERHAVPFMRAMNERRKAAMGLDALRPWDLAADERGREPLRPFENGQQLIERTRAVFDALDPGLAEMFRSLGDNVRDPNELGDACLDLDSRKGKASGGYQYQRDRSRVPFIFMNAAGLHRDVETMVHEAGHAFHSMLCNDEPLLHYRHSPIEFAEVASMTMELLTMPHWGAYYPDGDDADRARRKQMEGSIALLPWIATIDAFQHWIYLNPDHSRDERTAKWLELDDRFGATVDWSGLEDARAAQWQRQGHLFGVPFYYIEYGIAQLGSLGIWLHALERGVPSALDHYTRSLSLGGSKPLPALFEAAGVPFDFGPEIVGRLVEAVEGELAKLPE